MLKLAAVAPVTLCYLLVVVLGIALPILTMLMVAVVPVILLALLVPDMLLTV